MEIIVNEGPGDMKTVREADMNGVPFGEEKLVNGDGLYYNGREYWKVTRKTDTIEFTNGAVYSGEVNEEGIPCGRGAMKYPTGTIYEGEWADGMANGSGYEKYSDGSLYRGSWLNDKRSGKGRYTLADGSYYSGEWLEDKPNGSGHFNYKDGSTFSGEWLDGKRIGKGMMIAPDGKVTMGLWKDDVQMQLLHPMFPENKRMKVQVFMDCCEDRTNYKIGFKLYAIKGEYSLSQAEITEVHGIIPNEKWLNEHTFTIRERSLDRVSVKIPGIFTNSGRNENHTIKYGKEKTFQNVTEDSYYESSCDAVIEYTNSNSITVKLIRE